MVVNRGFGSITADSQLLTNSFFAETFEKCFWLFGQMHVFFIGLVFMDTLL